MNPINPVDDLWLNRPHTIRQFLEFRPRYAKLAEEVAYILENTVRADGIEYSAVTHRNKTMQSFCEKIARKRYQDFPREMTDLAAVRIV